MKTGRNILFAASLFFSAARLAAQAAPDEIVFNGLTSILGDERALIKVQDAAGHEKFCLLAAGQRDGDIELLAVDFAARKITLRNHDVVQDFTLYDAPEFTAAAVSNGVQAAGSARSATGRTGVVLNGENPSETVAQENQAALNPGGGFARNNPAPAAENSGTGNADNPASQPVVADSSDGTISEPADPACAPDNDADEPVVKKIDPLWASRRIEEARLALADEVRTGKMDPLPLTVLTPDGTPADLIGPDKVEPIPRMQ